jgi:hypothetical protein
MYAILVSPTAESDLLWKEKFKEECKEISDTNLENLHYNELGKELWCASTVYSKDLQNMLEKLKKELPLECYPCLTVIGCEPA